MNFIRADFTKNRLYIKFGDINEDNAHAISSEIRKKALKLKNGFGVLTDLSDFNVASQRFTPIIRLTQEFLMAWGAGKIVRVASSIISMMQFDRLDKESGIDAQVVATVEEGERALDWWEAKSRSKGIFLRHKKERNPHKDLKKYIKDRGLAFPAISPK